MRAGALLVLVALSCRTAEAPQENRTSVARVSALSGTVEVLRAGGVDWATLMRDASLYDDDRVRTFKGAWAQLAFAGGSSLKIDEESLISLGAVSVGGGILVERGTVEGELQPGLRVKTPALEAENARGRDIVVR